MSGLFTFWVVGAAFVLCSWMYSVERSDIDLITLIIEGALWLFVIQRAWKEAAK